MELSFGLSESEIEILLTNGLKPEEIGGDAVTQQKRIKELLHWFVRLSRGNANPKWTYSHAMELAYYIASRSSNRFIDIDAVEKKAWLEGVNITAEERGMLERINRQ